MSVVDQAHDVLLDETIFQLYPSAFNAWAEFGEWNIWLTPQDAGEVLDEIREIGERLEALRPAIVDRAGRNPAYREWLQGARAPRDLAARRVALTRCKRTMPDAPAPGVTARVSGMAVLPANAPLPGTS
jgi:hypothetical protein